MGKIGYYRYKIKPTSAEEVVNLYDGTQLIASACVKSSNIKSKCDSVGVAGNKYVKYLDPEGRYRFHMFNEKWKVNNLIRDIGNYNKVTTSIETDQSDKLSLGKDTERNISLFSTLLNSEEKKVLSDILLSPRVYLRVGDLDRIKDWVLVSASGDGLVQDNEKATGNFSIDLQLPKHYTIKK